MLVVPEAEDAHVGYSLECVQRGMGKCVPGILRVTLLEAHVYFVYSQ